jgi:hypothetical protein
MSRSARTLSASRRLVPLVVLAFLLGVLIPAGLFGQATTLARKGAEHAEPFARVAGLREVAPGRVLVSDGIEERVLLVELAKGSARQVGRAGPGPQEYKGPDALHPLPEGRTLLVDLGNSRLTTLGADGAVGESRSFVTEGEDGFSVRLPAGTDARGRLYYQPLIGGPGRQPDSARVVRFDRATGRADTVAKTALPLVNRRTSGGENNRNERVMPRPFTAQDAWAPAPDGRIAIARANPYRLDWVGADGRITSGTPVAWRPVPIREGDKQEWIEAMANGLSVRVENRNGQQSMSFSRGGMRDGADPSQFAWPEAKPAFPGGAVRVTPEGEAWVERYVAAGALRQFDVFDARGRLTRSVLLPAKVRLVGFGQGVAYGARMDEDGMEWLAAYAR